MAIKNVLVKFWKIVVTYRIPLLNAGCFAYHLCTTLLNIIRSEKTRIILAISKFPVFSELKVIVQRLSLMNLQMFIEHLLCPQARPRQWGSRRLRQTDVPAVVVPTLLPVCEGGMFKRSAQMGLK